MNAASMGEWRRIRQSLFERIATLAVEIQKIEHGLAPGLSIAEKRNTFSSLVLRLSQLEAEVARHT